MLIDLLNSSNYIMINREAIRLFGLNTAVYCAELLNIYKKAAEKNKFVAENAFKVDRGYVTKQTTLSIDDQLKCDLNLQKVNVINISKEDPDVVRFNVETFASLLSSEDVKILDDVKKKVQVQSPKGTKEAKRDRMILTLKESIVCKDYDLMLKLRDWIDTVTSNPSKFLSKPQVDLFVESLMKYCKEDMVKAKEIVDIATIHQYIDCTWAINLYEKNKSIVAATKPAVRVVEQKRTTKENLWEGEGF